jgi:hypothetical protein
MRTRIRNAAVTVAALSMAAALGACGQGTDADGNGFEIGLLLPSTQSARYEIDVGQAADRAAPRGTV